MKYGILLFAPVLAFAAGPVGTAPTFNKDIAPIFYDRCVTCHREGNVAPMSLLTYKDARPWTKSIREKVANKTMPPWTADPRYGHFMNDRQLTKEQADTIVAWVDAGAKEGSEKLPAPPKLVKGWNLGEPDQVFEMAEEYTVPTEGVVDYQHFAVPTNFKEDKWIRAAEIRSLTPEVVHHVIVFMAPPATYRGKALGLQPNKDWRVPAEKPAIIGGQKANRGQLGYFLAAWAPGERGTVFPEGSGMVIPAGSTFIFQVHYTPKGKAMKDRAKIGLYFNNKPVENEVRTIGIQNGQFKLAAGDPHQRVDSTVTFTEDAEVWSLGPHMHLRGTSFEFTLVKPDGAKEILLSVPKYDFNWQMVYTLAKPLHVAKGSRIDCVAYYDNSKANKFNPDPTKEVTWGDQTWEEMMIGFMTYSVDSQRTQTTGGTK